MVVGLQIGNGQKYGDSHSGNDISRAIYLFFRIRNTESAAVAKIRDKHFLVDDKHEQGTGTAGIMSERLGECMHER